MWSNFALTLIVGALPGLSILIRLSGKEHPLFKQQTAQRSNDRVHSSIPWAFITGSSSGIGYGIAHELCRRGFNIVLHGRDSRRLSEAVNQLRSSFPGIQIKSVCFDASTALTSDGFTPEVLSKLEVLEQLTLRILVNNIGIGFDPNSAEDFSTLTSQSLEQITRTIDVNIRFTTYLTHHLLSRLRTNATSSSFTQPGRSLVVNVGSLSDLGIPWVSVYSASKSYIATVSRALDTELKGEGWPIDIKCVVPGDVDSPNHRVGPTFFTPTSAVMGRTIVEAVANERSGVVIVPYWAHWIQWLACIVQPFWLLQKGFIYNLKQQMQQRRAFSS